MEKTISLHFMPFIRHRVMDSSMKNTVTLFLGCTQKLIFCHLLCLSKEIVGLFEGFLEGLGTHRHKSASARHSAGEAHF
jgi:hypothetical protein